MRILCPHCQNPIELVKLTPEEIPCPSCGSSFRIEGDYPSTKSLGSGASHRTLGRFELLMPVGMGGFGTVYRAHDPQLDRTVAIKIPRAGNFDGDEERSRFLREARSVAQLRHPAIVPVHEVGEDNGTPYLVSDFVQGVTLTDQLSAGRPTLRESARVIALVADALQFAHEHGVVHRDIKPSNIMIDAEGQPHVMDFGLAKREAGEITMTVEGQVLGTPAFMSPEQAKGEGHKVDGRSDVYSLGVILYLLVTGELPFRGNQRTLLHQVVYDEPKPPSALNDRIPRDLETITQKAIAKEPSRRYASAKQLAADLRHWLDGEPILARPVGCLERTWRWCRRNPSLATTGGLAAAALVVAAVVGLAFGMQQFRFARREFAAAQTERGLRAEVTKALDQSKRYAARLSFQRGLSFIELGQPQRGLPWLGRALRDSSAQNVSLQRSIRTSLSAWGASGGSLRQVLPYSNAARAVVFSPDGKTVLTGSWDKTARLWNAIDGTPVGKPMQHDDVVWAVAFSPDGKTILTGSWDSTARLWNVANGAPIGQPMQHDGGVRKVAFSPDGKTLLTGSLGDTARLWNALDGTPIGKPMVLGHGVVEMAFSPDGKTILTGSNDETARLWNAADGTPIGKPMRHGGDVLSVAFSPNGKTVLTGSADHIARLWSALDGAPIGKPMRHSGVVWSVAFSPDGKTVLTGSLDRTARLWNALDGAPLGKTMQHGDAVTAVAFSPDGKTVLTTSHDKSARLWSALDGTPIGKPMTHGNRVSAIAFSPDGKTVLTGSDDNTARLWNALDGAPIGKPMEHGDAVQEVTFSPDGQTVLTGSSAKTRLWNPVDGAPLGKPLKHGGGVNAALSPDGRTVVTGSDDNTARLWKVPAPLRGDPARVELWIQVITGLELDANDVIHVLDATTWRERKRQLDALGGPPAP